MPVSLTHCPDCGHLMDASQNHCSNCLAAHPHAAPSETRQLPAVVIGLLAGFGVCLAAAFWTRGEALRMLAVSLTLHAWTIRPEQHLFGSLMVFLVTPVLWAFVGSQMTSLTNARATVFEDDEVRAGAIAALLTGAVLAGAALVLYGGRVPIGAGEMLNSRLGPSVPLFVPSTMLLPVVTQVAALGVAVGVHRRRNC